MSIKSKPKVSSSCKLIVIARRTQVIGEEAVAAAAAVEWCQREERIEEHTETTEGREGVVAQEIDRKHAQITR